MKLSHRPYLYVASSWRNETNHAATMKQIADLADVYNFREPTHDASGFAWAQVDPEPIPDVRGWSVPRLLAALDQPISIAGFHSDMNALKACDGCVLVLPCGRSAHLEAGWAAGAGKPVAVYAPPNEIIEPELMYGMVEVLTDDITTLRTWVESVARRRR